MLDQATLSTLSSYTEGLTKTVTLVVQTGEHQQRAELMGMLEQIASVSTQIKVEQGDVSLRSPVSFSLLSDGQETGIVFSGIPGGHEFNSLILAILQAGGRDSNLDQGLRDLIRAVTQPLKFEVFVSLSCHNCPDVVQALNQFALLNDEISAEMIDGGLFADLVEARNIQGVPSVFLNGKPFANGKIDPAKLVDKLLQQFPELTQQVQHQSLPLQDVTIIGGGPAGIASAIYAARKGLNVTLVADRIGGQVKDTVGIENLISVPKTTGEELSGNMLAHLRDYAVTLKQHVQVSDIENGHIKTLHLSSGERIETKTLIIATGAKWRELGEPGEKENIGQGVAYCPHCDGPFFKGKSVAVIGGGNSGIEAALDLAGIASEVTVFEFLPELKADKVLVDKAKANDKITLLTSVATKEIIAENNKVVAIDYIDRNNNEQHRKALSGVFVQIGLLPNSAFLGDLVERTKFGEVIVDAKGQTSQPGIFAAGDVTTVPYKQIVVAMGEGAKAALSAFDYLIKHY